MKIIKIKTKKAQINYLNYTFVKFYKPIIIIKQKLQFKK